MAFTPNSGGAAPFLSWRSAYWLATTFLSTPAVRRLARIAAANQTGIRKGASKRPLNGLRGPRLRAPSLRGAVLASEIVQFERQLRPQRVDGHVDATLRLLDPSIKLDSIPNKRPRKNVTLFRQRELGRRETDHPLSTAQIVHRP